MNQSQFSSFLKTALGAVGGGLVTLAASKGVSIPAVLTGPDAMQFYGGVFALGVPLLWGWFSHTPLGNALTATATPGVTVKVGPDAPASLKAAASDPAVPAITRT